MSSPLLTRAQLLVVINRKTDWFSRHRKRLEAQGFPKPVPGLGNRWDPVALEQWRASARGDRIDPPPFRKELERDWGAELDRRAGELGKSH